MAAEPHALGSTQRRIVDVSDLPAARVRQFAKESAVYLERKGGRTFLVTE